MFQRIHSSLLLPVLLLCASHLHAGVTTQTFRTDEGKLIDLAGGKFQFSPGADQAAPGQPFASLDKVDWSGWKNLQGLLSDVHKQVGIPALAAAYVRDGKVIDQATVGTQEFGVDIPVGPSDRFHLGSVTKSITATLIGKLVEDGKLAWSSTIAQVLPDMEMQDAYRQVTLESLLQHRGGLPAYTQGRPNGHPMDKLYTGTATEKRHAFLTDVLMQAPATESGGAMLYSNAGYAIAGHMAERATGVPWETLIKRHIFKPLGMQHAGFGIPDHPMGHAGNGPEFHPVPLEAYPRLEVIAPAGNIHCSISDLARYALAHLAGLNGKDGIVSAKTMQRLHRVPDETSDRPYAAGWFIRQGSAGEPLHTHGGTVGASFAEVGLYPKSNSATLFLTTVSQGIGEALSHRINKAMIERYGPEKMDFASKEGGSSGAGVNLITGSSTAHEDAQLWQVLQGLADAFNNEDRAAYRALFSPDYNSYDPDTMFDFMAQAVLPMRGGVEAFHSPSAPIKTSDSKRFVRAVVFHLENGYPGYFGVTLDADGKIIEFSLFIKGDMCPNGTDRQCSRIVKRLGQDF